MTSLKVEFPGSLGARLAARLEMPEAAPAAFAIFAHCFTCSKDTKAPSTIARALTASGIAVLRFDFTGLGGSDGDFANTHFTSNVDDVLAAVAFLREQYAAPAILVGHSWGGAAVLAAAAQIPECRAVVTIGAPFDPAHVTRQFGAQVPAIESEGAAEVSLAGRSFRIRREFLADVAGQQQADRIARLGRALLVFHAPEDTVVGIDNARAIFEAARHPKSFVSLSGADHLLSRREDGQYVAAVLAAWAQRYIGTAAAAAPAAGDAPAAGHVRVSETRTGKFAVRVQTSKHSLIADEPAQVGGNDGGPSPYELLQAALGACTAMTLRLYADGKQLPLTRVTVDVEHARVHAADCADCETKEGRIDELRRRIRLEGALTDAQRTRLAEIADRCPVHRTLEGEIRIRTALAD